MGTGYDYSWFILTQSIIKKEFALSGSEQNPDLTGKSWRMTLKRATNKGAPAPVEAFKQHGADFIVRDNLGDLVAAMNKLTGRRSAEARPHQGADRGARPRDRKPLCEGRAGDEPAQCAPLYRRQADPHGKAAPHPRSRAGPLIAVKLNILTRKTLGGFETDLDSRVFGNNGKIIAGLYAAGEAAGFGGGGVHGYRSLEGTFLGGCLFSGRNAGRAAAKVS